MQEPRKSAPGLDSLLTWAFRSRASRIGFQPGHPVWVRIHGQNHRATRTSLDEGEFAQIVNHLYGADGMARLQGGNDFDTAYAIPLDRSTRLRFRLNATPTRTSRRDGGNIVLRPIPDLPPSLADQSVEQGILDSYRAGEGMVIVAGGTGSGKSTLIAGMTKAKLDDPDGNYDIVEGAAPIEFLLERVRGSSSTMNQTEIPRDIPSFSAVHPRLHAARADRHHCRRMPRQRDDGGRDPGSHLRTSADDDRACQQRAADVAAHRQPLPRGRTRQRDFRGRAVAAACHQPAPCPDHRWAADSAPGISGRR